MPPIHSGFYAWQDVYKPIFKASELFGGGINAFSRYERGETPIPRSLSQLLQLLYKHPEQVMELQTSDHSIQHRQHKLAR